MHSTQKDRAVAVLGALAAMTCFSSVPVFLRHFRGYLDPWWVNAVRYSTAAVFWLPFVLLLRRRPQAEGAPPPVRSVWAAALLPAAVNTLGQVGWASAPYFVDAPTISFVIRTSFLFTVLLGFLFVPAERALARRTWFYVGAALSILGVALMYLGKVSVPAGPEAAAAAATQEALAGRGAALKELAGVAILIGTALCWGGYAVGVRRLMAGYRVRLAFGVISLYTTAPLLVLMLLLGHHGKLAAVPGCLWLMIVLSGFVGIAFGHVFYYRAIHGIGPVVTSGITLGGPFVTCLVAFLFLGETITPLQLGGGVTVLAGGASLLVARAQAAREGPELPGAGR